MKTAKGNNYTTLLALTAQEGSIFVEWKTNNAALQEITTEQLDIMTKAISERIQTEKKPAEGLKKQLARIEIHREQLLDAYVKLFELYANMITPPVRLTVATAADRARYDMLNSIGDMKMLRSMCAIHLGDEKANDFVLPGEKAALIDMTVKAMNGVSNG